MITKATCGALALSAAVMLSACSGVEEKRQLYVQASSIAPLNVPSGMDAPESPRALALPEVDRSALGEEPFNTLPPSNLPVEEPQTQEANGESIADTAE